MEIVLVFMVIMLLIIISQCLEWTFHYKRIARMLEKQNKDFVNKYEKLSDEFVLQFKKYEAESQRNRKTVETYTNIYDGFLEIYKIKNN